MCKGLIHSALWGYFALLKGLAPFHRRARELVRAQRGISRRYAQAFPVSRRVVWFHVSSLGEFEQGRPLIEAWRERHPDDYILLTFFSPSGYRIRQDYPVADRVDYLPFDSLPDLCGLVERVHPALFILVKYDLWPRLLSCLHRMQVPVYLVSARFRPRQVYFRWYGGYFRSLLSGMRMICVQDEDSQRLLSQHGLQRVRVTGDTRVDRVLTMAGEKTQVEGIQEFAGGAQLLIGGSTWEAEEEMLYRFFKEHESVFQRGEWKLVLAPHEVSDRHLRRISRRFGESLVTYSHLQVNPREGADKPVLLIDRIGLLGRIYHAGAVAVVGGGFGKGIHNILEPAACGLPVLFGPRCHKFPEAADLISQQGGFLFRNFSEFNAMLTNLLINKKSIMKASQASRAYVEQGRGSTSLIISCLLENSEH